MPVYILQAGDTPNVKIGWADADVERRRSQLQPGCWLPLRVIRVIEGPAALERWLHRRFRPQKIFHEWHTLVPEMLTVTVDDVRPAPKPDPTMPSEMRAKIAASMCKSWKDGSLRRTFEMQQPAERVPDVERITGYPRHQLRPDLWDEPAGDAAA